MQESGTRRQHADLKELVVEASRQALNRELAPGGTSRGAEMFRQAREAKGDMAVFARVLEATRANLDVMNRLRELRAGRLEYGERLTRGWPRTEGGHGDN